MFLFQMKLFRSSFIVFLILPQCHMLCTAIFQCIQNYLSGIFHQIFILLHKQIHGIQYQGQPEADYCIFPGKVPQSQFHPLPDAVCLEVQYYLHRQLPDRLPEYLRSVPYLQSWHPPDQCHIACTEDKNILLWDTKTVCQSLPFPDDAVLHVPGSHISDVPGIDQLNLFTGMSGNMCISGKQHLLPLQLVH